VQPLQYAEIALQAAEELAGKLGQVYQLRKGRLLLTLFLCIVVFSNLIPL
jgi:hypothetical protein